MWLTSFPALQPIACANLPYNITTPVLTALIEAGCFASITVMIQREVALRICAAPGSSDYGAFSVFCQYHTQPELLFEVGPECFLPAPKVTSAVIRLVPRSAPPQNLVDESFFFQVVRASFAQRRKTLLNGLSSAFGSRLSKDALRGAIESAGLPADIRGERLGIPEFATLASALQKPSLSSSIPGSFCKSDEKDLQKPPVSFTIQLTEFSALHHKRGTLSWH